MKSSPQIKDVNIGIINLGVDHDLYRIFCREFANNSEVYSFSNILHHLDAYSERDLELLSHSIAAASDFVVVLDSSAKISNNLALIKQLKELQMSNSLKIIEVSFVNRKGHNDEGDLGEFFEVYNFYQAVIQENHTIQGYEIQLLLNSLVADLNELWRGLPKISGIDFAEKRIEACKRYRLNYLDLSNLGLLFLPDSIKPLSEFVEYVCLGNHQYFKHAEDFAFCQEARFGLNSISDISVLSEFKRLKGLYCSQNQRLSGLESWSVDSLFNLQHLDLYNTAQIDLTFINSLPSLKMLDISYIDLKIGNLPSGREKIDLEDLSAEGISFKSIERFLNSIDPSNLKSLNLTNTGIKDLTTLTKFKELRILNLSNNKLKEVDELVGFSYLEELSLSMNSIERLDSFKKVSDLDNLMNLRVLNVSDNKLDNIDFISNFPNLESFRCSNNSIENLEPFIGLSGFKFIDLSANKIAKLDPILDLFVSGLNIGIESEFNSLCIDENPLTSPPMEVVRNGREAVLQYYREVTKSFDLGLDSFKSNEIRVLVLGNAYVGKSNLAHFIKSGFKSLPPSNEATHGIDDQSFEYEFRERKVHVRMIDFGGQDYYHDLHHIYFSTDTIYFLLWTSSLDNYSLQKFERYSSKEGKQKQDEFLSYPVSYWLDAIKYLQRQSENRKEESISLFSYGVNNSEESTKARNINGLSRTVLLIQTKRSENNYWYYNRIEEELYRELIFGAVSIDLYLDKDSNRIIKKGIESLKENFEDLIENLTKTEWPGYYQAVVDFFKSEEYQSNAPFRLIEKKRYELLNLEEAIRVLNLILKRKLIKYNLDELSALAVLDYLSNRGFVLSLPEQKFCFDPKGFSNEVYRILSPEKQGDPELGEMNRDFEKALCALKVIAPHPTKQRRFIAPQLLPESISSELKFLIDHIKHTYLKYELFGFIHKSFLIDIFHAFSSKNVSLDDRKIWKNGLVFRLKESEKDDVFYKIEFKVESNFVIEVSTSQALINYVEYKSIAKLVEAIITPYKYEKYVRSKNTGFVNYQELSDCVAQKRIEVQGLTGVTRLGDIAPWWAERINLPLKKLFISYASPDTAFVKRLKTHLEPHKKLGIIDYWFDHMIEPGTKWDEEIKNQIDSSDVILLLVSPDFLASSYVRDVEIPRSLDIVESSGGNKAIVSLMIRHVSLEAEPRLTTRQFITRNDREDRKDILIINDPGNDEDWVLAIEKLFTRLKDTPKI